MHTQVKALITALVAAAALAALVGSASANSLSVTSRTIRVVWSSFEFTKPVTVRCRLTIEGTLHENTISKVSGSLIGYITAAAIAHPCTGGSEWVYNGVERNEALGNAVLPSSFPWHLTYEGFNGSLPTPTAIRILLTLARFLLRSSPFGIPILCLYRTGSNGNATLTGNLGVGGRVTSVRASGTIRSETGGCPERTLRNPEGDGIATQLGNSNSVSITLI